MNHETIQFFTEEIPDNIRGKKKLQRGICELITLEKCKQGPINIIFCRDQFLSKYNREYLHSDFLTDVIAFDLSEETGIVSGDIYISLERVKENTRIYKTRMYDEITRVIIHGILHLIGWEDGTEGERKEMRLKEDYYLRKIFDR